jgi:tetratricopeptide (TPR) repeat protein
MMSETARAIQSGLEALKAGETLRALEHFSIAIETARSGESHDQTMLQAEALRRRGLVYFDLGHSHDAITDLTQAIELNSGDFQAFQTRALVRLALGNPTGALSDLHVSIELNDTDPRSHQLAGIAQRRCTQIDGAIGSFTRAARLYLDQGDKEKGRQCLEQIDRLRPRSQPSSGTTNITDPSYQTDTQTAARLTPPRTTTSPIPNFPAPHTFYRQAIERAEAGDASGALRDLEWVLKTGDVDPEALCCRAAIYSTLGRFQDALADFNRVLKADDGSVMAYGGRGRARLRLGDIVGAISDFTRAIELDETDATLCVTRGVAYRDLGNYSGAFADFERAIAIDPHCATAYLERGATYARQEELTKASEDYQQAASLFCEQEAWDAYKATLKKAAKLQPPRELNANTKERSSQHRSSQPSEAQLQQKLLRLVGGHWEIAERLLAQAKEEYPGLTDEWYLRQVIAEIEGDD